MRVFCSIMIFFVAATAFAQSAFVRTYGSEGTFNEGKGIVAFPDSTYILLGNRLTPGGQSSAWLFRVDSTGAILWEKYFDSYVISSSENLSRHDDTSVVVSGTVLSGNDYSMLVARIGLSGTVIWEKVYGTEAWDQGLCTVSDSYGNVYLTGYGQALDTMDQDILLYKLDGNTGDSLLSKRIDDGFNDKGVYLDTISGDNLLMASHSLDNLNEMHHSKIWRLDFNLDTIWTSRPGYHDTSATIRVAECLFEDTFSRIVFAGEILPDTGTVYRFWYGCIEQDGVLNFEHIYAPFYMKNIRRGICDTLGQYHFTGGIFDYYFGFGNSDVGYWRDSLGWGYYRYYGALQDEEGMDLDLAADGGYVFIGTTKNYGPGVNNIFLVKVGSDYIYDDTGHVHYTPAHAAESENTRIYPNPSSGAFRIDLPEITKSRMDIYDLQGMQVASDWYYPGETYTLSGLSNGVYLIKITSEHQSYNFRLILQQD
ncbi:hypothetical protein DSECCO2_442260 [anaerobic digester metagenome]